MRLLVSCKNRPGIALEILDTLARHHIDLRGIEVNKSGQVFLRFQNLDFDSLQKLMPEIRRIEDVSDVVRVPYMPLEREQSEIHTLLHTLPDPVISIDQQGNISVANDAALSLLKMGMDEAHNKHLKQWLKGFNLAQWLNSPQEVNCQLEFAGYPYLASINPITVSNDDTFAGGVIVFKNAAQLGKQIAAWNKHSGHFEFIQAKSPRMKRLLRQAKRITEFDAPLLITGETGTGKELLARACHQSSLRNEQPFLTINCAGLPEDAAESELFGQQDADGTVHKGVFEVAASGTVFMQEVAELPQSLQAKFLRLLQDGSYRRVGSEQELHSQARVICSTQQDLLKLCEQGCFRDDLLYRLSALTLDIPPLRERHEDIMPLARHFLRQYNAASRTRLNLSELSRTILEGYSWPGNVRQLQSAVQQAASVAQGVVIEPENFQLPGYAEEWGLVNREHVTTLEAAIKGFESELLQRLYPAYPSSRKLAQRLGISHTAIANKLRDYGIGKKATLRKANQE
ncbi:MAG: sigma 54-interacting transcriptional regulator [Porticoccaceae bacterium]|nr:sigma 54-interacting transcriptional regulator [Porticoccaceae bacterium]